MSPLLLFKKLCLGSRLDTDKMRLHLGFFFEKCISVAVVAFSVDSVHYLRDLQISFFNKILIKNGSHDTIYTFRNYFVTVFSVFSKISCI